MIGICEQLGAGHADVEGAATDRPLVDAAVHVQEHDVAVGDVATHAPGDRDVTARLGIGQQIVGRHRVDDDARGRLSDRWRCIDTVALAVARSRLTIHAAGGRGHACLDRVIRIGHQLAARDSDAENATVHRPAVFDAVDRDDHRVAVGDIAADAAGDRDRPTGFGEIDQVVRGHRVQRDARLRYIGIDPEGLVVDRGGLAIDAAGAGRDAGLHGLVRVGGQFAAGHVDAETPIADHAGVGATIHDHRHRVTVDDIAADAAGERHDGAGLRSADHVVRGHGIEADARVRNEGVAAVGLIVDSSRLTGRAAGTGGNAGLYRLVGIGDQFAARYRNAELTAADRPAVFDAVDDERDDVAVHHIATDRAGDRDQATGLRGIDDVVRSDRVQHDARGRLFSRQAEVDRFTEQ